MRRATGSVPDLGMRFEDAGPRSLFYDWGRCVERAGICSLQPAPPPPRPDDAAESPAAVVAAAAALAALRKQQAEQI